ncbi:unnamed protein product [Rhizophagus irregularis]|uniref:BED-type domain-containing protein n=1 Tax=Rhizophagus irregularis TaxID=588596 RepID=A0A915YVY8_9GLOM|nr:unnamed protein product [Rhizophagus irregularis]
MSIDLTEPTTPPSSRLGKRKALHSDLFTKKLFVQRDLPPEHKDAKTHREVQCLNCSKPKIWYRKIGDSSTSNLWRHVEIYHPEKDLRPKKKAKNAVADNQSTLDEFMNQKEIPSRFTQTDFRKFLTGWIIADDQPFTTTENIHFRNMVKVLNSDALVPKADTIKKDVMESFEEERKKRKILFQNIPGRISFALDAWTSINGYGFLAITVHWITKDWKLCDSLLDFIKLSGPHSGENLRNAFVESCNDFGILEKIFAITSDNASNNDTFMRYLEDVCQNKSINFNAVDNYCRCIAHIMNLAVQDILKQIKAGEAESEDTILNNMDITVTTGDIIPKALDATASSDKELRIFELSDDEWDRIERIVSVLMIFVQATNVVSFAKYPMLSSAIPVYNYLIDELEEYCDNCDSSDDIVTAVKAVS